jgi:hypothetical protein
MKATYANSLSISSHFPTKGLKGLASHKMDIFSQKLKLCILTPPIEKHSTNLSKPIGNDVSIKYTLFS